MFSVVYRLVWNVLWLCCFGFKARESTSMEKDEGQLRAAIEELTASFSSVRQVIKSIKQKFVSLISIPLFCFIFIFILVKKHLKQKTEYLFSLSKTTHYSHISNVYFYSLPAVFLANLSLRAHRLHNPSAHLIVRLADPNQVILWITR